jgi:hypothetical protein
VKIWDLLKGCMSLPEVRGVTGKNESSILSVALNSAFWACVFFPGQWSPWNFIPVDTRQTYEKMFNVIIYLKTHYALIKMVKMLTRMWRNWITVGHTLVAHACNPNYSGGKDQEDCNLKPAWVNSSQDPISKNPNTKQGLLSGLASVRPWVQVPALPKRNWITHTLLVG